MGRLGLEIAKKGWHHPPKNEQKPEISFKDIPIAVAPEETADPIGEKCLAYLSYYAMVFSTCCVFIPAETSSVFASTTQVFKTVRSSTMSAVVRPNRPNAYTGMDWTLRTFN